MLVGFPGGERWDWATARLTSVHLRSRCYNRRGRGEVEITRDRSCCQHFWFGLQLCHINVVTALVEMIYMRILFKKRKKNMIFFILNQGWWKCEHVWTIQQSCLSQLHKVQKGTSHSEGSQPLWKMWWNTRRQRGKKRKKKTVDGTSITTEMQLILFLKLQRLSPMIAVKFKKGGTVSQLEQKYALMECEYYH